MLKIFKKIRQRWRNSSSYETVRVTSEMEQSVDLSEDIQRILLETDLIRSHIRDVKFDLLRLLDFPENFTRAFHLYGEKKPFQDVYTWMDTMMLNASMEMGKPTPNVFANEQTYSFKRERSIETFFNLLQKRETTKKHTPEKIIHELENILHTEIIDKEILLKIQNNLKQELSLFQRRFHLLQRYPRLFMKQKIVEHELKDAYHVSFVQQAFTNMRAMYKIYYKNFLHEYHSFTPMEHRLLRHAEMNYLLKMKAFSNLYPTFHSSTTNAHARQFQYYFSDQYICIDSKDEYEVPISNYILSQGGYGLIQL